jgi:hypothetical protein
LQKLRIELVYELEVGSNNRTLGMDNVLAEVSVGDGFEPEFATGRGRIIEGYIVGQ